MIIMQKERCKKFVDTDINVMQLDLIEINENRKIIENQKTDAVLNR